MAARGTGSVLGTCSHSPGSHRSNHLPLPHSCSVQPHSTEELESQKRHSRGASRAQRGVKLCRLPSSHVQAHGTDGPLGTGRARPCGHWGHTAQHNGYHGVGDTKGQAVANMDPWERNRTPWKGREVLHVGERQLGGSFQGANPRMDGRRLWLGCVGPQGAASAAWTAGGTLSKSDWDTWCCPPPTLQLPSNNQTHLPWNADGRQEAPQGPQCFLGFPGSMSGATGTHSHATSCSQPRAPRLPPQGSRGGTRAKASSSQEARLPRVSSAPPSSNAAVSSRSGKCP
nr:uncharacterized protein LOC129471830 [Symphalangus syndactylus]